MSDAAILTLMPIAAALIGLAQILWSRRLVPASVSPAGWSARRSAMTGTALLLAAGLLVVLHVAGYMIPPPAETGPYGDTSLPRTRFWMAVIWLIGSPIFVANGLHQVMAADHYIDGGWLSATDPRTVRFFGWLSVGFGLLLLGFNLIAILRVGGP